MTLSFSGPGGANRRWTLGVTSIAFFMVALDALVVITALPAIQRDLGSTITTLEWTINAYTLAFAAGIITAAALGDRLGRRRVFVGGVATFTIASAACAMAPTVELLILARVVQGLGAAAILPLSLTILAAAFPPERRGTIVGIWGGIAGIAVAGGPLVGGALTQGLDWHWIFWVNVPIGVATAIAGRARLAESFGPPTRLDLPAVALVTGGAVSLAYGLVRAGELGFSSPEVVGTLGLGLLLIVAFVGWEARSREPMLPLGLFRSPGFAAAVMSSFLLSAALVSAAFLGVQFFQFAQGDGPFVTGLRVLPWTATPVIVAPLAGLLSDRVGRRPVMVLGLLLQGLGLLWLSAVARVGVAYPALMVPLVVAGVGVSMALPTTATAAVSAVAPRDMGKASGVNGTLQRFGTVFGVSLVSIVFAANGHLGSPASYAAGFAPAMATSGLLSLVGAVTALGTPGRRAAMAAETRPASQLAS